MLKRPRPNDLLLRLIINQVDTSERPQIAAANLAEPLGIMPISVIPFDLLSFGNTVKMVA